MESSGLMRLEACLVDLSRNKIYRDGRSITLTETESALLAYLAARPEAVIDQDELLREVWGYSESVVSRTVRTTISRLRKKIERDPADPDHLVTVFGQGYRFQAWEAPAPEARLPMQVPAEVDEFIGRDAMLDAVERTFADGRRLVTLVGSPGMGKTRLAQRFALTRGLAGRQGAWFCDLTAAHSAEGVVDTVAETLGVPVSGHTAPVEQVGRALQGRGPVLLLLDNFEGVVTAAADTVGRWLHVAPEVEVLVTSREPLRLRAEALVRVPPLASGEAVALFVDRARARGLDVDEGEVGPVVAQLEGIPLAIELAASQAGELGLDGLLRLLSAGLAGLRSTLRDVAPHHATLRTAIARSWDLLSPAEAQTLAHCSVFRGGWTAQAAQRVVRTADVPVAVLMDALVAKSLVRAVPREGGAPRYAVFESIREFAAAQLSDSGGREAAERRHGAWFARSGDEGRRERLHIAGGPARLAALRADVDNLVVAMERAVERNDTPVAVGACLAAQEAMSGMAPGTTAERWITSVLTAPDIPPRDRVQLLVARGHARRLVWRTEVAREDFEAARSLALELGDARWTGRAAHGLGLLFSEMGALDDAAVALEEALEQQRLSGDRRMAGRTLGPFGAVRMKQGRPDEALDLLERAAAESREVGDRFNEGSTLANLAALLQRSGRVDEAVDHASRAVAISRELHDRRKEAMTTFTLGSALDTQGNLAEARRVLQYSANLHRQLGHRGYEGTALGHLANAEALQGRVDEAIRLYDRAIALLRESGSRGMHGVMLGNQGDALLAAGRLPEARARLEAALEIHRDLGNFRAEGAFLASLAVVSAHEGDAEGARACLVRADALLERSRDPIEHAKATCRAGQVELLLGDGDAARGHADRAASILDHAGVRPGSEGWTSVEALQRSLTN